MTEGYMSETDEVTEVSEEKPSTSGSGSLAPERVETGEERRRRELEEAKANRQTRLSFEQRLAALEKVAGLDAFKGPAENAE